MKECVVCYESKKSADRRCKTKQCQAFVCDTCFDTLSAKTTRMECMYCQDQIVDVYVWLFVLQPPYSYFENAIMISLRVDKTPDNFNTFVWLRHIQRPNWRNELLKNTTELIMNRAGRTLFKYNNEDKKSTMKLIRRKVVHQLQDDIIPRISKHYDNMVRRHRNDHIMGLPLLCIFFGMLFMLIYPFLNGFLLAAYVFLAAHVSFYYVCSAILHFQTPDRIIMEHQRRFNTWLLVVSACVALALNLRLV